MPVAHDKALRTDDAPVLSDYILKGICNRGGGAAIIFFLLLLTGPPNHDYMKASKRLEKHVPGYNYFSKICDYHYDVGEL